MEKGPPVFQRIIGELLSITAKPLMTLSIREYLWGYQDPLLHILKREFPELVTNDQVAVFGSTVSCFT